MTSIKQRPAWFWRRAALSIVVFAIVYTTVSLVWSWVGVYWFGRFDPKFGSLRGQFQTSLELLPFFTVVATGSHSLAVWSRASTMARLGGGGAGVFGAGAALLTSIFDALLDWTVAVLPQSLDPLMGPVGVVSLFIAPAAITLALIQAWPKSEKLTEPNGFNQTLD